MTMSRTRSRELFKEAASLIPGGVNSPVRAFKSVGGDPPFIEKADGCRLTDVDGNEYIDLVCSYGPLVLGHRPAPVAAALAAAVERGTTFGAPTEGEVELARLVVDRVPSIDMLRLVNSGTEATMSALRLARAVTGRSAFIKFNGNYHGHGDSFLVKAGSGALTLGDPDSPGVTPGTARDTLIAEYNDLDSVESLFERHSDEIAAVFVEPVAGNIGTILPAPGFLEGLRTLCDSHGALLVFDEVMTGFRVAPGGYQELCGVQPDLTTLGKIIGGGLPIGAYGGRRDLMEQVAPAGKVYQAGTLSGNPLAVSAGRAMLSALAEPGVYEQLEDAGAHLEAGLRHICDSLKIPATVNRVGSMLALYFHPGPVDSFAAAQAGDHERFKDFFHRMLDEGIYLPPSPFEAWFLSTAHDLDALDRVLEAARTALT